MNATMPAHYRQFQQQQPQHARMQQTPHKRVPQPGHGAPGPPRPDDQRAMMMREQEQLRERVEREKRRAARPTDKTMPEGVEDLIIGDGVDQYRKLRAVERKLDAVMMRKRLDLLDPLQSPIKKYMALKIWLSNTVENQPWQGRDLDENAFDFNMGVEATYKVKIEGRVVDDVEAEAQAAVDKDSDDGVEDKEKEDDAMDTDATKEAPEKTEQPPQKRTKLSHFFKQITIDFDRNKNLQPDGMTQIEWKKPPGSQGADFDNLEFERKSDENINITINLYRNEKEECLKLSKGLRDLLDIEEETKANVIMMIWQYVKAMGLQQDEEKRNIQCDDRMKAVFGHEQIRFPDLHRLLDAHLTPLEPLRLSYTIRCDPEYHQEPTIYVLTLPSPPTPSPTTAPNTVSTIPHYAQPILDSLNNTQTLQQISSLDHHTALLVEAINNSQRKHNFMQGMAKDPVGFTKRWMGSQRRDLECVLGEGGSFEGEWALQSAGEAASKDDQPFKSGGMLRGGALRGGKESMWGGREVEEAVKVMAGKGFKGRRAEEGQ